MRGAWLSAPRRRAIVAQLNRAARTLNPLLVVIAVGLAILDLSCYAALELGRWHALRSWTSERLLAPPAVATQPMMQQF